MPITTDRRPLTDRQRAVYDFIRQHIGENGFPPSFREIMKHMDVRSPNSISQHLAALQRKGWLTYDVFNSRSIRIPGKRCPHCGGTGRIDP